MKGSHANPARGAALRAWTTALVLATAAVPAFGSDVGLHLGYSKAEDSTSGNGLVGAHLELGLLSFLGIQGAVDYRLVETIPVAVGGRDYALHLRSVPVTLSARVYAPLGIRPFAEAGAGWYVLLYDYAPELEAAGLNDETQTTFGWHVGAGADVPLTPTVSVFGLVRAVFVDPNKTLDQPTLDRIQHLDYDSVYSAAGLSLHF